MRNINASTGSYGVKFILVGGLGIIVQLILLKLFNKYLGWHYLLATLVAVELTILHNFYWHQRWTWQDRPVTKGMNQFFRVVRFNLSVGLISLVGNLLIMKVLVGFYGLPLVLANLLTIVGCSLANFLISHYFVFTTPTNSLKASLNNGLEL